MSPPLSYRDFSISSVRRRRRRRDKCPHNFPRFDRRATFDSADGSVSDDKRPPPPPMTGSPTKMCRQWLPPPFWEKRCFFFGVFVLVMLFCCCCCSRADASAIRTKREDLAEIQKYLTDFGYLPRSRDGAFALRTEESVRRSLSQLQEFAGLPATGRLDGGTLALMRTPRCGVPDREWTVEGGATRRKRFIVRGQKWPYTNLTWSVMTKQVDNLNHYEVRYVMSKALALWSKHSQLTFTEVDSDKADILIYFYRGDHGDSFPFDGRGVVLAHAFFPTGMKTSVEVHFDADEKWTTTGNRDQGTNLFNVAAHEVGHSLGLSHSHDQNALMYPWYKEIKNGFDFDLPDDDKQAIQYLYGARDKGRLWETIPEYHPKKTTTTTSTTTTTTTTTARPRVQAPQKPYDPRYPHDRHPYYPSRKPYYSRPNPMHPNKKPYYPKQNGEYPYGPQRKYPHHIPEKTPQRTYPDQKYPRREYPSLNPDKYPQQTPERDHPKPELPKESPTVKPPPNTCDTSYDAVAVIRREVFIFKDAYFWRIGDSGLMPGYPAEISRLWHGLPKNLTQVDAVYERTDGRIVFFIGSQYYVFSTNVVERGYPKPIYNLGLPREVEYIDGAMVWGHNGQTYFYSRDRYWRFDEESQKVELDYPRDMSMWKGVGTDIDAVFQWKDGKTYFFKGKYFWKFNDIHMRVEHVEPKLSAPFWMGCSTNYEENDNDLGQKLPYKGETINSSARSNSSIYSLVVTILLIVYSSIC